MLRDRVGLRQVGAADRGETGLVAGGDELREYANCISVSPQSKRTASSTSARLAAWAASILWASLVLAPITLLLRYVFHVSDTTLFVAAAVALVPLAWLIGEATEHAGEHTGPGIGGFLNASFGNAPELIIALFAVNAALPNVVRGSLAGSVVSNILLVLGPR